MRYHGLAVLIGLLLLAACYTGDYSTLSATSTVVDTSPVLFGPANGVPAHGPTNRATICLAPSNRFSLPGVSTPMLVRNDGTPIVMQVYVVFGGAPRRLLTLAGYAGCGRHAHGMQFVETVPEAAGARARGIEMTSNGPVQVDSVWWWSGDARKLPVMP